MTHINDAFIDSSAWYKALADSLRLQVLRVLKDHSFGALELASIFDVKQNTMSHHLKMLINAGLLEAKREGTSIFYRRCIMAQSSLTAEVFYQLDRLVLDSDVKRRSEAVLLERVDVAREFFEKNVNRFRAQQDLIAEFNQYGDLAKSVLKNTATLSNSALELGCGQGEFLLPLAKRFDQVWAVDISESMLQRAEQHIVAAGFNNVEFVQGELTPAITQGQNVDVIVCNMVLHHLPKPSKVFELAANMLAKGGVLLITDLCEHQNEWAKTSCGDLWLGFDQQELTNWANSNNLQVEQQLFLALRNGFQVQTWVFRK